MDNLCDSVKSVDNLSFVPLFVKIRGTRQPQFQLSTFNFLLLTRAVQCLPDQETCQ